MDWRTFTPSYVNLYGIYSEDFITFGQFPKGEERDALHNDELLLKIVDEKDKSICSKVTFKFDDNQLTYKYDVNEEKQDTEVEFKVEEVPLTPEMHQTWSEVLFYGLGNKRV